MQSNKQKPRESSQKDRVPVPKLWGFEDHIVNNDLYCGKVLHLKPGWQCSLHCHVTKHETFLCISGLVGVEYIVDGKRTETILSSFVHDALEIPAGTPHRFWSIDGPAELVEFSTHHSDSDVVRMEASRKRNS